MNFNKNYLLKLRHILPAFALAAWGSVLLLGIIRRYLFLTKYPMLELDEEIWNFWIPVIFPWLPILLWLKPRFDMLLFKKDNDHRSWQMQGAAWVVMSAILIFSQHYLTTATGKLLEVENVREIRKHDYVRYYRIKQFHVYPYIGGVHYAFRQMGRYNQDLYMYVYFVNPILTHKTQHIVTAPLYWYGAVFNKQISNWHSNAKKERLFRAFFEECMAKMKNYEYRQPDHFENKPKSWDRDNFRIAVQNALRRPVNDKFLILQPESAPYEMRNGHKIAWMFGCFFADIAIFMLLLIKPRLASQARDEDADPVFQMDKLN